MINIYLLLNFACNVLDFLILKLMISSINLIKMLSEKSVSKLLWTFPWRFNADRRMQKVFLVNFM